MGAWTNANTWMEAHAATQQWTEENWPLVVPPSQRMADNSPAAPSDEPDDRGHVGFSGSDVPLQTVAGGLAERLRAVFAKRRVTVAELASLLAWVFTGVSFVVTKRSFEDASPLVRHV